VEKRNKFAQILFVRQAQSLAEIPRSCKQKVTNSITISKFSLSSNIFTSLMESSFIVFVAIQFSMDKINLKTVSKPFTYFPQLHKKFRCEEK